VGCWAEEGSAVVGSEELGFVSSVFEMAVVSVILGLKGRVEVFGSLFAGVDVGSGTQTQIRLYGRRGSGGMKGRNSPAFPLSYGSPLSTFPISPDTGSCPLVSLPFVWAPLAPFPSPQMARDAADARLFTVSMVKENKLSYLE
jgi:hypothetical protein